MMAVAKSKGFSFLLTSVSLPDYASFMVFFNYSYYQTDSCAVKISNHMQNSEGLHLFYTRLL